MKIVHVIPHFLPENVAGTEVYCWSLCKYLQRHGVVAEVVIPGHGLSETTAYEYDEIRVVKYAEPTEETRLHLAGLSPVAGLVAFTDCLKQARPDVVHFHGIYGGTSITIRHMEETKRLGFRTMYTVHLPGDTCRTQTLMYKDREPCDGIMRPVRCAACSMVHHNKMSGWMADIVAGLSGSLQRAGVDAGHWNSSLGTGLSLANRVVDSQENLERLAISCDKIVFYAKWFRQIMIANGFPATRTAYIPPALPSTGSEEALESPVSFNSKDSCKLVFVGRIDSSKGLDLLLAALRTLREEAIELSIYGRQTDDAYNRYCRDLHMHQQNIHWRGILSRSQLLPALRKHDLLCLPSAFSEMSPLVIQEAFAAGLPVLASDVCGNAEQVRHNQNGLLFPFKSMQGLCDQLHRVTEEKGLLSGLKSRVVAPPSFDRAGEQYLAMYYGNTGGAPA